MKKAYAAYALMYLLLGLSLPLTILCSVSLAQPPITPSGLNTAVSAPIALPSGQTQFNITGGTRPGGGVNLFHSFGDFNVPNNNIANFLNNSGLATSNILGRVTGGNISNIFGTIQTTGFGNANLYLMNPAGFLFGPNATLNVGGMVSFTSADYLRLADGVRFRASPNASADALLSVAPVAAFGFLGSNPGAITVQGSHLAVAEGTGISLVGGDITVELGRLTAPSGQINLVSIAGRGEAGVTAGGIAVTAGTPMGNIVVSGTSLRDHALFDASGNEGGTVVIRGGQVLLARSDITTQARTANHTAGGIVVEARDSATLNDVIWFTSTSGFPNPNTVGGAGPVSVTAPSVTASNVFIDTIAGNNGPAGDVTFNVGSLTASTLQISSFVNGASPGPASGNVSIRATGDVTLQNGDIATVTFGAPDAGQIAVRAAALTLTEGASIFSGSQFGGQQITGRAGNIVIDVGSLTMQTSSMNPQISTSTISTGHGGDISVAATGPVTISRGAISASGGLAEGGSITLSTPHLTLDHFGQITTSTVHGNARAGNISVNVGSLNMLNGGKIESSACCSVSDLGSAGNVNIVASKSISMAGVSDVTIPFPTEIGSVTNSAGNAGLVQIVAPTVHVGDRAVISASSQSAGHAGTIVIDAARNISTDNGTITAAGHGQGGNVSLHAGKSVQIRNGSLISADNTGVGDAGHIVIQAGTRFVSHDSTVSAQAEEGHGGTIHVEANKVRLTDSQLTTSVTGGPQSVGGTITVDAKNTTLKNSQLLSTATQGTGGAFGIASPVLHGEAGSVIDVSSQSGTNGTVTINGITINP